MTNTFVPSARKYRPQKWADVLGQDATVRILQRALQLDRIASAYLLCGQKGTGKTSIARLVAKTLNCEDLQGQRDRGVLPEPCGSCDNCQSFAKNADPDVLEIDAASNRGIDDMRELKRIAQQQPRAGKWRVTIIDECHGLSREAWQSLLALFEAPPDRFLPILCTTEHEKVMATVASRCMTFQIRPLPYDAIQTNLSRIFAEFKQPVDNSVLFALARAGNGSLRDVQQVADQLILCAHGEHINDEFLESQAGIPTVSLYRRVAGAITAAIAEDITVWFDEVDALWADGIDLRMLFFKVIPTLLRDFRVAIVSRGQPEPVVPYESGIAHELFESHCSFSHQDLAHLWNVWEKQAEWFGVDLMAEKHCLEFWLLNAWDRCAAHTTSA